MRYTEDDVTRELVDYIRNEADLDDLAAMYSEHKSGEDDPVVIVVRGPRGPESDPYINGKYVDGILAAAPELLAALKKAVAVMRDNNLDESMAGEFELFTDAITKAEGSDE